MCILPRWPSVGQTSVPAHWSFVRVISQQNWHCGKMKPVHFCSMAGSRSKKQFKKRSMQISAPTEVEVHWSALRLRNPECVHQIQCELHQPTLHSRSCDANCVTDSRFFDTNDAPCQSLGRQRPLHVASANYVSCCDYKCSRKCPDSLQERPPLRLFHHSPALGFHRSDRCGVKTLAGCSYCPHRANRGQNNNEHLKLKVANSHLGDISI